jgi:hypothetical protein
VVARDRRRALRRVPDALDPVSRMRLRAGRELQVVDLSTHGALVEGDTRLLPNTHVDVHVQSATGRVLVRSRVVRAFVAWVTSDRIVYRGALAFDQPVAIGSAPVLAEYGLPRRSTGEVVVPGTAYPVAHS